MECSLSKYRARSVNPVIVKKVKHAASTVARISGTSKSGMKETETLISERNLRRLQILGVTKEVLEARDAFEKVAKEAYRNAKAAFAAKTASSKEDK